MVWTDDRRTCSWLSSHRCLRSGMEIGSKLRAAGTPTSIWPLVWAAISPRQVAIRPDPWPSPLAPLVVPASTRFYPDDKRGLCRRGMTLLCPSLGPPQRIFPLQTATKTATNGKFWGDPRNATALESSTYDSRAASRAERTGFEPADQFPGHRFSKPALSTTQPPLHRPRKMRLVGSLALFYCIGGRLQVGWRSLEWHRSVSGPPGWASAGRLIGDIVEPVKPLFQVMQRTAVADRFSDDGETSLIAWN